HRGLYVGQCFIGFYMLRLFFRPRCQGFVFVFICKCRSKSVSRWCFTRRIFSADAGQAKVVISRDARVSATHSEIKTCWSRLRHFATNNVDMLPPTTTSRIKTYWRS
ncbi:unnamed protein product, partial [Ectocarpus sp. 12 AP-2014]